MWTLETAARSNVGCGAEPKKICSLVLLHGVMARAPALSGSDERTGVDGGTGGGGDLSWRRGTAPIAESSLAA